MNVLELFKHINTFVFDVDGVLTDGNLIVLPGGVMARRMNVKDGYALQLAVKQGYNVVVISGGNSAEVKERLALLGIAEVYMRVTDKKACLQQYMLIHHISKQQVLFMGDDIPDYEVMRDAGIACCPANAVDEIKNISQYISPHKGGEGCARDVIVKVMKLQGKWHADTHVKSQ